MAEQVEKTYIKSRNDGDIVEAGLALAWQDPTVANEAFRQRIERLVRATERLDLLLPQFQYDPASGWVEKVDQIWQARSVEPTTPRRWPASRPQPPPRPSAPGLPPAPLAADARESSSESSGSSRGGAGRVRRWGRSSQVRVCPRSQNRRGTMFPRHS